MEAVINDIDSTLSELKDNKDLLTKEDKEDLKEMADSLKSNLSEKV